MAHPDRDVFQFYEVIEVIGEGSMSTISKVRKKHRENLFSVIMRKFKRRPPNALQIVHQEDFKAPEHVYALKTIIKDQVNELFLSEMRNEISILKHLDHANIVRVFESYEHKRHIYLVMEFCSGGDLYERCPYSEPDAARLVAKILSAVSYLHKQGVVHRDIKFENILFENRRKDAEIKIIDFGLSKKYYGKHKHQVMTETVGTIYTMAPQVRSFDLLRIMFYLDIPRVSYSNL